MEQNVKSERPPHDELIAQIDNFLVYNLNNSYPSEKHEKEIELKMYMRIDKICATDSNKSDTKKSILKKFLPKSFINTFSRDKSEFIEVTTYNLNVLEHFLKSIFENKSYVVPFSHKDMGGNVVLGVDLDLKDFIKKIKSGKIKITWYIYDDLEQSYNIIRIAHTLQDRIKEKDLPMIIKLVQYVPDKIDSKRSNLIVNWSIHSKTFYDPRIDEYYYKSGDKIQHKKENLKVK